MRNLKEKSRKCYRTKVFFLWLQNRNRKFGSSKYQKITKKHNVKYSSYIQQNGFFKHRCMNSKNHGDFTDWLLLLILFCCFIGHRLHYSIFFLLSKYLVNIPKPTMCYSTKHCVCSQSLVYLFLHSFSKTINSNIDSNTRFFSS